MGVEEGPGVDAVLSELARLEVPQLLQPTSATSVSRTLAVKTRRMCSSDLVGCARSGVRETATGGAMAGLYAMAAHSFTGCRTTDGLLGPISPSRKAGIARDLTACRPTLCSPCGTLGVDRGRTAPVSGSSHVCR